MNHIEAENEFNLSMNIATSAWKQTLTKISTGSSKINWDENLINCMNSSFSKINFLQYQNNMLKRSWTLVHGDFHPANMFFVPEKNNEKELNGRLIVLDWELIGFGNGPQDLAQFMISHTSPILRKKYELNNLQHYFDTIQPYLKSKNEEYSWENCKEEYISGGSEKWIWLMGLLSTGPDPIVQYFQDQLSSFLMDHNVTPDTIGMPRV